MVDVESGRVVDFEMVQRTNASGYGNYQGTSNGMEWKRNEMNEVNGEEMGRR
jgi:hypothetical protein